MWATWPPEKVYYPKPGAAPIRQSITKGALPWYHPLDEHEQYPAAPPDLAEWARVEGPDVYWIHIEIDIPPWNKPSDEMYEQFKDRFYTTCAGACDRAFQEHIDRAKEWTSRPEISEWLYVDGLAMWQAGQNLSEIHSRLDRSGLHVGRDPKDPDYNSAISKGIGSMAARIKLDWRPV